MRISPPSALRALLCLGWILGGPSAGCSAEDAPPGSASLVGPGGGPDVPVSGDEAGPLPGPPCEDDLGCVGVFIGLSACERARCAPRDIRPWICVREPLAAGEPCEDGDPCTRPGRCDASGTCGAGEPLDCDDGDPCTDDRCDPVYGCQSIAHARPCDDGNPCTSDDACGAAGCGGTYDAAVAGCDCTRDADCPAPEDACAGTMSCRAGHCALQPPGGVRCDPAAGGPCQVAQCVDGGCALVAAADDAPCDDGNPCTAGDRCLAGVCAAGTPTCPPCTSDADCADVDDGDLCNGRLVCVAGACQVEPGSPVVCDPPPEPCLRSECQADTGICALVYRSDGVSCDDGDACTLGDTCRAGECTPTVAAVCGPPPGHAAACWDVPACNPASGCVATPLTGTPCDDGLHCEVQDACLAGDCLPGSLRVTDQDCDDGNPCTVDTCDDAVGCVQGWADGGACDDGDPCTQGDRCLSGACQPLGLVDCDDHRPCTTDLCIKDSGCVHILNTQPCDDGDPCTVGDTCQGGVCKPGGKVCPCNDDADCSVPGGGACAGLWHCIANQCVLESEAAQGCSQDGLGPCSQAVCDAVTGLCAVVSLPAGSPCQDGDPCTIGAVCSADVCTGGYALDCDDHNPCTDDTCAAGAGCVHTPTGLPCDDDDPCTEGTVCTEGACVAAGNVCDCLADSDCAQPDDRCHGLGRCVANTCVVDPNVVDGCADMGAPCVSVSCDAKTGTCAVTVLPDGAPCQDGDACTISERCDSGACVGGKQRLCSDGNPCTDDACDPATGCVSAPRDGACNDGDPCTTDERCVGGACVAEGTRCLELCHNGRDDDGDLRVDCADEDCAGGCDACSEAPVLACDFGAIPGQINQGDPSQVGDTACGPSASDRVYRFVTTVEGAVSFGVIPGDGYRVQVVPASADGGCGTGPCMGAGPTVTFAPTPGQVYHVVVSRSGAAGSPGFVLTIGCAVPCPSTCDQMECGTDGCGFVCGGCDDGDPCTLDQCDQGTCAFLPIPGCCSTATDCTAGGPCVTSTCEASQCVTKPIPGCCTTDAACDDGVFCTADVCEGGTCVHQGGPGCCASAADCDDSDPCTSDVCVAGGCLHTPIPGCCGQPSDCPPGSPCEVAGCSPQHTCTLSTLLGCCADAQACDDGLLCTLDTCDTVARKCVHTVIPGCCTGATQCAAPAAPCLEAACSGHQCAVVPIVGCCTTDADCATQGACLATECVAGTCVAAPIPGCCDTASDCEDGDPCTVDECAGDRCTHLVAAGCCATSADCDDGDACSKDACVAGTCVNEVQAGCCTTDADCLDSAACTTDRCVGGQCAHTPVPECCTTPADCTGAGPCLDVGCVAGRCAYSPKLDCCASDADCTTGSPCLLTACVAGICIIEDLDPAQCCLTEAACPAVTGPCLRATCESYTCGVAAIPGCCASDADCPSSADPCAQASCLGNACVITKVPGCCATAADCPPEPSPCATTSCAGGSCQTDTIPGCCEEDAACDPPPGSGACDQARCVGGVCTVHTEDGCCEEDSECNPAGLGAGACQLVGCVLGRCTVTGNLPGCCTVATDCSPSGGPCRVSDCVANQCVTAKISGCCATTDDCGPPPGPCLVADCANERCQLHRVPGCCSSAADCPSDGNVCTAEACVGGACVAVLAPGCCQTDAECAGDAANAGECTQAKCVGGACVAVPQPGCCAVDADCAALAGPCTRAVCRTGACLVLPETGCCTGDSDCPEDDAACVATRCQQGACTWEVVGGDCCSSDADCPAPDHPCHHARCVAGGCETVVAPACDLDTCVFAPFDGAGLPPGWSSGPAGAWTVADGALVGVNAGGSVAVAMPDVVADPGASLRFRYRLAVAVQDCTTGRLSVELVGLGGASSLLWSACYATSEWRDVVVPLDGFGAAPVSLRFRLHGTGSATAWIDDAAIEHPCQRLCTAGCDDNNPCTADACSPAGLCEAVPVPGCCASDTACVDADPCTLDRCTAGVCERLAIPGCVEGACLSETVGGGPLGPGWTVESSPGLALAPTAADAFSPPAALTAQASGPGVARLRLPPLVAVAGGAVSFAVNADVGADCALGSVAVEVNGTLVPVACASAGWRTVTVPLALQPGAVGAIAIRLEALSAGASFALDDVRVQGPCHPVECLSDTDCADPDPCTEDVCDVGYVCRHVPIPGCCAVAGDCPAVACAQVTCVEGACHATTDPDCDAGVCWAADLAASGLPGWGFPPPAPATSTALGWAAAAGELVGSYTTPPAVTQVSTAVARLPRLLVGDGGSRLRFSYRLSVSGPTCDRGALELWADDTLLWVACASRPDWTQVDVPLGAWVGQSVRPELRLRSDPGAGSSGTARIRAPRVTGSCLEVQCRTAAECDDGNPCTDDACLGFHCVFATNQVACDDGDACTTSDLCQGGVCAGDPLNCFDDKPCTDDACDPALGCLNLPNEVPCDDGDPCTAGDSCAEGACRGHPVLCKDFNGCTRDGCTPGVGCEFAPEPFGAACADDGAALGACWAGVCVDWQVSLAASQAGGDTRLFGLLSRTDVVPLTAAGSDAPEGAPRATVFRIDHNTLALIPQVTSPAGGAFLALAGPLAVGTGGDIVTTSSEIPPPALGTPPGVDLHALAVTGQTWFFGGDGSATATVQSTLRRCKLQGGDWQACHVMPVVRSLAQCARQVPFHVRAVLADPSQKAMVAGFSVEAGNHVARVAVWDGNTVTDCPGLGVHNGLVTYDDPTTGLDLAIDAAGVGDEEGFLALGGVGPDAIWAAGHRGLIARLIGQTWVVEDPATHPATAAWSPQYTVRGLTGTASDVHFVGDGVGVAAAGCRDGFYLHGRRAGSGWVFDRLSRLGSTLRDCGDAPFGHLGARSVVVDKLTGDLYIGGWGPDAPGAPKVRRGLVMRLRKP